MARETYIECIVRTSDGGFESSLRVPVNSTEEQRKGFAKLWIDTMINAMTLTPKDELASAGKEQEAEERQSRLMMERGR